jgi:hypothetical protein
MKLYKGVRLCGQCVVFVDTSPLDPRYDLRIHSPTGFDWGYAGSGPSQLALAILADCTDPETALKHYQEFKSSVVASFPDERWTLSEDEVRNAIALLETAS